MRIRDPQGAARDFQYDHNSGVIIEDPQGAARDFQYGHRDDYGQEMDPNDTQRSYDSIVEDLVYLAKNNNQQFVLNEVGGDSWVDEEKDKIMTFKDLDFNSISSKQDGGAKMNKKKKVKTTLKDYFKCGNKDEISMNPKEKNIKEREWNMKRNKELREKANDPKTFNEGIMHLLRATEVWRKLETARTTEFEARKVPLQDKNSKPVLLGADVVALYPSIDAVGGAQLVYEAIMESNVKFEGIDFEWLSVYLYLTMGENLLREYGLENVVPERINLNKKSSAVSLSAQINRDMDGWRTFTHRLDDKMKRTMVALMMKVAVLVMMKSTCYTFGGLIYKQEEGTGIGLRGSACVAKLIMGMIDKKWARNQSSWGLVVQIYLRYIDDLRVYMAPINPGWSWGANGWTYNEEMNDNRDPLTRTAEEMKKTLEFTVDFLKFTTESEKDFVSGFLPSLDAQTQVQEDGKVLFKFFRKPMANNVVIQFGTGLPKNVIFSALRQDLVRRMLNCCSDLP